MTRTDILALQVLPRFADGRWHPSALDLDLENGVRVWWLANWRTWKCLRRGWLEYERPCATDKRPFLDRRGWLRLTVEGRLNLLIAQGIAAKRGFVLQEAS